MKREQEITARRLEEMKISVASELPIPKETSMVIKTAEILPKKEVKKRNIVVNTNHCRGELDTIQYVIDRCGFRESNQAGEGDILWYLNL
jgi:hypothetical protein